MEVLQPSLIRMLSIGMKTKKTLLFGGTFDPVHEGHMHIIRQAELYTDYERLIIMPARLSNFKQHSNPASAEDRLAMLHLALSDYKPLRMEILISTLEVEREGVSYTYDTVKDVLSLYPVEGRLGFLMGDDLLKDLDKWYKAEELRKLLAFVCFTRSGSAEYDYPGYDIRMIEAPSLDASSTDVRNGRFEHLSKGVRDYVVSHGLYRTL